MFPYCPNRASCLLTGVTINDLCEALSGIPPLNVQRFYSDYRRRFSLHSASCQMITYEESFNSADE